MRFVLLVLLALFGSLLAVVDEELPRVRVDLKDGSRVVGELDRSTLEARTKYGEMTIPLKSVHSFHRRGDGQIRLAFRNGDELTVQPKFDRLKCSTLFGQVELKMEHVKTLFVKSQILKLLPGRDHVVAYFGFDTSEDGLVANQAQDAMHATNIGGKWVGGGVNGGAIYFDGSSRLEVPHDIRLCPKTLTFAAWIFPTEESSNYEMIMAKTNASSWAGGYGVCRIAGDSKNVRFFVNGYTSIFKPTRLPIGKWTHLACVAHGEGIRLYVNGKVVGGSKKAKSPHPLAARVQHTNTPMTLGGDPSHYGWRGVMDEVLFFDRPLSDSEIRQLYEMFADTANSTKPKVPMLTKARAPQPDRAGGAMESVE